MPRSKVSDAPECNRFAASFMHLITWRWEKARLGSDYGIVDKILYSLDGDYFKGMLT